MGSTGDGAASESVVSSTAEVPREIGIRELRQNASTYVSAANAGHIITVTDRGVPVAKLVPLSPIEQQLAQLLRAYSMAAPSIDRRLFAGQTRVAGAPLSTLLDDERQERVS